jgi:hypothetical protein
VGMKTYKHRYIARVQHSSFGHMVNIIDRETNSLIKRTQHSDNNFIKLRKEALQMSIAHIEDKIYLEEVKNYAET